MAEPGPAHLRRDAYIDVRQSTLAQTVRNTESLARQYDLAGRARELGWAEHQVVVVDDDLGRSGATAHGRKGFSDLVADVGLGKAGIVLSLECSRLARNNSDWYQLLDLCVLTDTLIADADGLYHPGLFNDRLVLGLSAPATCSLFALPPGRRIAGRAGAGSAYALLTSPRMPPSAAAWPLPVLSSCVGRSGRVRRASTRRETVADRPLSPRPDLAFCSP
jgi:hypothetical protein